MKVYFASLGCDKNLVDSEHMLSDIVGKHELVSDPSECEIAIVNTCAFIKDAKEESINTILSLAEYKESNLKYLIITGCLAERYSKDLKDLIPEIDAFLGISAIPNILNDIDRVINKEKVFDLPDNNAPQSASGERYLTPPFHTSFLKIAEGCDKKCTYCAIPMIRGSYRSIPMEELLKEAKFLADNGVKELILVAQETTVYGVDLYKKKSLPELLRKLSEIESIEWIRIMYCYPEEIDDELIEEIKNNKKVCKYLDIPIQHSSDRILQRMGRRTSRKDILSCIAALRKAVPEISLRTSLIAGFPGETEEDFEDLKSFIKKAKFDRLGVFTYSKEEGTPAAKFKNQVPAKIKKARQKELMLIQREISLSKNKKLIGKKFDAMIDGYDSSEHFHIARLYKDAPDIDGNVFIEGDEKYLSGDFVKVKITDCNEYDLIGETV